MENVNSTSMVFYLSYMESAQLAELTKEERCEFYEGILTYATKGILPRFSNPFAKGLFVICKENIDANTRKLNRKAAAVENGKKGGAPKGNKNAAKKKMTEENVDEEVQMEDTEEIVEEVDTVELDADVDEEHTIDAYGPADEDEAADEDEVYDEDDAFDEDDAVGDDEEEAAEEEEIEERMERMETLQQQAENNPKTTKKTTPETTYTVTNTITETSTDTKNYSFFLDRKNKKKKPEECESMDQRNRIFFESLKPYFDSYGIEVMRGFYEYWSEPNPDRTKMRFELERTWDIGRRLNTWRRNRERYAGDNCY